MLSLSQPIKGAARGEYYLNLAKEDYYLNGGEPPGRWLGKGAVELGLMGEVASDHFRALLRGFGPDGVTSLVQNSDAPDRQSGWDLTFSAPKSVSVLWSQAEDEVKRVLQKSHAKAVETAFAFIEEQAGLTRRGKGGKVRERVHLIAAAFEHGTSRALDPQLHTHAVLINIGLRKDRSTGTLWSEELFKKKMQAGKVYQETLARLLKEKLNTGLTWKATGRGRTFELDVIPREICRHFSKRRVQVEAALEERGAGNSAVASKLAALQTREKKQAISRSTLFGLWRQEAALHGYDLRNAVSVEKAGLGDDREDEPKNRLKKTAKKKNLLGPFRQRKRRKIKVQPVVIAEKQASFLRFQIVQKKLFPDAPAWSPFSEITAPHLRVKSELREWMVFFSKKASQGLLTIARNQASATIAAVSAWKVSKTRGPKAVVTSASEKSASLTSLGIHAVPLDVARRSDLSCSFVILDEALLRGTPSNVQRVAPHSSYMTDELTLRKVFKTESKDSDETEKAAEESRRLRSDRNEKQRPQPQQP